MAKGKKWLILKVQKTLNTIKFNWGVAISPTFFNRQKPKKQIVMPKKPMSEIYQNLNDNLQKLLILQIEEHIANVKAEMYEQPYRAEITILFNHYFYDFRNNQIRGLQDSTNVITDKKEQITLWDFTNYDLIHILRQLELNAFII